MAFVYSVINKGCADFNGIHIRALITNLIRR
jgi:hypothetical protein